MTTNFDFLKSVDKDLYNIVSEAEKLYRDEYFEQCMGQTRRFGEHVCKKVVGFNDTFDEMLATLKDKNNGSEQEKEFIDDLYFLKKNGNNAVHSLKVEKNGITALECLQRAFEIAINYSVYNRGAKPDILDLNYDVELLATGRKSKSLAEKYNEKKALMPKDTKQTSKKTSKTKPKKARSQKSHSKVKYSNKDKKGISVYWIIVGIFSIIGILVFGGLIILTLLS